ncbi:hypothetical protein ACTXT7_007521 [Hymenolepis weldensis]
MSKSYRLLISGVKITMNLFVTSLWPCPYVARTARLGCLQRLNSPPAAMIPPYDDWSVLEVISVGSLSRACHPNISWIVAVVIAVLILLIVAILAVSIMMGNKGKTYLLEREERMRGNDPEKEFRDRDAFQAYERRSEPPIPGLNQSLEDTLPEFESDDEGELDYFEMDPGK